MSTHTISAAAHPFLIRAQRVTVVRNGRRLLDRIDLTLPPGRIVTVVGPNGAGKTTLVRVLLGLITPDDGRVDRFPELRLGYVPQRFALPSTLPIDVATFLRLANPYKEGDLQRVLARVGVEALSDRPLAALSGGELQRVLLARALLRQPQLLVLDEPAQGLDLLGQQEFYALLSELRNEIGCGILLISHDLYLVMGATDEVICLEGHICCAGPPEAIGRHPEYLRLFGPAAANLALYAHHHDHRHDLHGNIVPLDRVEKLNMGGKR